MGKRKRAAGVEAVGDTQNGPAPSTIPADGTKGNTGAALPRVSFSKSSTDYLNFR